MKLAYLFRDCKLKFLNKIKGSVNKTDEVAIEAKFDLVNPYFRNWLVGIYVGTEDNEKEGYIDRDGNVIWEPTR